METSSNKLVFYRKTLNPILLNFRHLKLRKGEELKALKESGYLVIATKKAQGIIQGIAQHVQERVHHKIASVVSRCLRTVFIEKPYEFRIIFERKRGRTVAKLTFWRDNHEIDPKTAAGGGVVDVAALALRLVCIILSRPKKRRLVILDEPFRFVSPRYQPRVVEMLTRLADEMAIQFIVVTNIPELAMGKVIRISP